MQVDGLDPSQAYLEGGLEKGIFRRVHREFIDPERKTTIPDSTYDALLCCAGFFEVGCLNNFNLAKQVSNFNIDHCQC